MVNWDEIAEAKDADRKKIVEDRANSDANKKATETALNDWMSGLFDKLEESIAARNAQIPLPGKRITSNRLGKTGFQLSSGRAIQKIEVQRNREEILMTVRSSGPDIDGTQTTDERQFLLNPTGGEFTATIHTGYEHGTALTLDGLRDTIISTFAWYVS